MGTAADMVITNLDTDNKIYDNMIEQRFFEYFEMREIDINKEFKNMPNSIFHGAFIYINEKCFMANFADGRQHNAITNDIKNLYIAYNTFVKLCRNYNVVVFKDMFLEYLGIGYEKFNSWNNNINIDINNIKVFINSDKYYIPRNRNTIVMNDIYNNTITYTYSELLKSLCFLIYKSISNLGKSSVRNKLADTNIGVITLANNDSEIGLEYEQKRNADRLETQVRLASQLPKLSVVDGKAILTDQNG